MVDGLNIMSYHVCYDHDRLIREYSFGFQSAYFSFMSITSFLMIEKKINISLL